MKTVEQDSILFTQIENLRYNGLTDQIQAGFLAGINMGHLRSVLGID